MGCGGSKDVVVATNVREDNNNSESKDVAITKQSSKCKTEIFSILLSVHHQLAQPLPSFLPYDNIVRQQSRAAV